MGEDSAPDTHSRLELLPNELLQQIWLLSEEEALPHTSKTLKSKLNDDYIRERFWERILPNVRDVLVFRIGYLLELTLPIEPKLASKTLYHSDISERDLEAFYQEDKTRLLDYFCGISGYSRSDMEPTVDKHLRLNISAKTRIPDRMREWELIQKAKLVERAEDSAFGRLNSMVRNGVAAMVSFFGNTALHERVGTHQTQTREEQSTF